MENKELIEKCSEALAKRYLSQYPENNEVRAREWLNRHSKELAFIIPIIQKAERKAIQDLYQTIGGDIVIPKEDWEEGGKEAE